MNEIINEDFFINGFRYFLITSIAIVIFAFLIDNIAKLLINRFNRKYKHKIATNQYLYNTIRALVWIVSLIIIMKQIKPLNNLGDTLLGATSILAIAIGIAAQATFGNYVAGFFLAVHQPFKVGDVIRIKEKNLSGTVKEITFRHTVLSTQEQTEIIIPNTIMNTVVVEDMSNGDYSELIEFKISNDLDLNKVEELIISVLKEEDNIIDKDQIKLIIKDFGKDYYDIAFPIHTKSLKDYGIVRNNIIPKLNEVFKNNNITLY